MTNHPTVANDAAYPTPEKQFGLTKRELFAYGAMQGMLSNPELYKTACENIDPNRVADFYSLCAVEHADSLIAALNNPQTT